MPVGGNARWGLQHLQRELRAPVALAAAANIRIAVGWLGGPPRPLTSISAAATVASPLPSAEARRKQARFWYGRMLAEGRGAATDLPAARACFLRASADGNGDATVAAAEMLVNGRGGPPDQPTAMRMFGHAAAQGHRGAQFALEVLQPPSGISPTGICPPGVSPPAIPPPGVSPPDIPLPAMATSGGECVAA